MGIAITEFSLNNEQKKLLYEEGKRATLDYFMER